MHMPMGMAPADGVKNYRLEEIRQLLRMPGGSLRRLKCASACGLRTIPVTSQDAVTQESAQPLVLADVNVKVLLDRQIVIDPSARLMLPDCKVNVVDFIAEVVVEQKYLNHLEVRTAMKQVFKGITCSELST
jgi:hypothetical protein